LLTAEGSELTQSQRIGSTEGGPSVCGDTDVVSVQESARAGRSLLRLQSLAQPDPERLAGLFWHALSPPPRVEDPGGSEIVQNHIRWICRSSAFKKS